MREKPKILIVDDSPELLHALQIFLEKKSYKVLTVTSDKQLITALPVFRPDVIILDVCLNCTLDGRQICKIIKGDNQYKHIPILLMSGAYERLKDFDECKADGIIEKPFNLLLLHDKIEGVLNILAN